MGVNTNTRTLTVCGGEIATNGICLKCGHTAQTTSNRCMRLTEITPVVSGERPDLIEALEEYQSVLLDEIDSLVGIAHVHGWRSRNVERGKKCREKIAAIKASTASVAVETVCPHCNGSKELAGGLVECHHCKEPYRFERPVERGTEGTEAGNRPYIRDWLDGFAKRNGFETWDDAINRGSISITDDTALAIEKYLEEHKPGRNKSDEEADELRNKFDSPNDWR